MNGIEIGDYVKIVNGRKFNGKIKMVIGITEFRDIYDRLICHYFYFSDGTKVQCKHCIKFGA